MKDDQSIERLLRSVRPGVPAPGGVGRCLDAETLAAWIDGGLTSQELRQAELHVSSCARCQAAVAATMRSAPLVAASEAERSRAWRLGWLVPLAAGVAAVGLWFMVPSRSELVTRAPESSQVAFDRQISPAPIEQPAQAMPARDERKPQSSAGKLADAPSAQNEERKDVATGLTKAESVNAQKVDEVTARARQEANTAAKSASAADSVAAREELAPGPPAAGAPAASAPAPSAPGTVSGAAPPALRAAPSSIAGNRSSTLQAQSFEIVSPNPSVRWRIRAGGVIEHSSDAGARWTSQTSGVSVDLLAGASPSPEVCWLVGRAGTVLRTTDGGRQWQRVTLVDGLDLQAVTAGDASSAEVTATDGRRFRTVDAGITWR